MNRAEKVKTLEGMLGPLDTKSDEYVALSWALLVIRRAEMRGGKLLVDLGKR
jgi:hypothetical protein